jgi:hypothetical protein
MGSSPKPPPPAPPPPPTPTAGDAAEGADRLAEDLRKRRRSTAGSFLAGETGNTTGGSSSGGTSYLG